MEHADVHRCNGAFASHEACHEANAAHHDEGVYVGYPSGFGGFACHADNVFGHGGVKLLLHHPETGYDEYQYEQSPVGDDAQKTATDVGHAFTFAGCLGRFVKQYNGQQGDECHGAGKVIDVNVGLVANLITQGVDNGFACKGSDVHHHVKNGVTACTGGFGGFFGNGSRYDGLDE
ncbi:hypothetical protein SDC9_163877 [bioreactor metagenome]|uniref:Uncharacterized protein n=1 Tax=bioreactor metagenome TaxID=1076179 RepID=A0A645FX90_9ZZZZ